MTYDHRVDPRSLHVEVDPEALAALQDAYDSKQRQLDLYTAQLAMFSSRAWQGLSHEMEMELVAAREALEDPGKVKDPHALAIVQGQIQAWKRFLDMPRIIKNKQRLLVEEMRHMRRGLQEELQG